MALDSIMHDDLRPMAPFAASNGLLGLVSLPALHAGCVLAGVLGFLILAIGFRACDGRSVP